MLSDFLRDLSPESPFSPYNVAKTLQSVPAPLTSEVCTDTVYVITEKLWIKRRWRREVGGEMRVGGGEKERNVGEELEEELETGSGVVVEGKEEEKEEGVKRGKRGNN